MKKYFFIGLVFLLVLSIFLIFYGAWLNNASEIQITQLMSEQKISVPATTVKYRNIYPKIDLDDINLSTDNLVDAITLIDGRVEKIFAPKNTKVQQGEVIFTVINDSINLEMREMETNILEASAKLKQSENVYERQKRLLERNATSVAKLQEAETTYLAAKARLEMYQVKRDQLAMKNQKQEITAPIDGKILMLYHHQGSYVQAGTSLALVGDFSSLNFSVPLENKIAQHLKVGQKIELIFRKTTFPKAYDTDYETGNKGENETFTASVTNISPDLNETAAIRNVSFSIDNSSGLLEPQTYSDADLKSRLPYHCLAIPLVAIIDSAKTEVFVVTPNETIERRKIRTGVDDGIFIEVIQGLKENDIVVTHDVKSSFDNLSVNIILEDYEGDYFETKEKK